MDVRASNSRKKLTSAWLGMARSVALLAMFVSVATDIEARGFRGGGGGGIRGGGSMSMHRGSGFDRGSFDRGSGSYRSGGTFSRDGGYSKPSALDGKPSGVDRPGGPGSGTNWDSMTRVPGGGGSATQLPATRPGGGGSGTQLPATRPGGADQGRSFRPPGPAEGDRALSFPPPDPAKADRARSGGPTVRNAAMAGAGGSTTRLQPASRSAQLPGPQRRSVRAIITCPPIARPIIGAKFITTVATATSTSRNMKATR